MGTVDESDPGKGGINLGNISFVSIPEKMKRMNTEKAIYRRPVAISKTPNYGKLFFFKGEI